MLLCAITDKQEEMENEGTTGRDEGCSGSDEVRQDGEGKGCEDIGMTAVHAVDKLNQTHRLNQIN